MNKKYPYLNNNELLKDLCTLPIAEEYVKITVLNWDEEPLQEVQGMIVDGNLNINGDSAMRRTINLTAAFKDSSFSQVTDVNNIFSINKKIFIEKGIKDPSAAYSADPIYWFPLGEFIINNCSTSHDTNNVSVSIQAQDKMCLLNGTCGGTISASTQFDKYDTLDENGDWVTIQPVVAQIIRELVNHFGGEQLGKILISDVDNRIKAVMRWLGSTPVYLILNQGTYTLTTETPSSMVGVTKFEYGDDVGFIYTDFIYNKELVGNPGDNVCTILDQIVSYLGGNYEYFYDVYGNFIFQEKKNYLNISDSTLEIDRLTNQDYQYDMLLGKRAYDFTDWPIFTSFSNAPQYNNIKNDFVVWGVRKTPEGLNLPIRFHLAIDQKPKTGNVYPVFFYTDPDDGLRKAQMPVRYESISDFPQQGCAGVYYQALDTGYVYVWRWDSTAGAYTYVDITDEVEFKNIKTTDWRSELYLQGVAAEPLGLKSNYYYTELANEWPKIYTLDAEYIGAEDYWVGAFNEDYLNDPRTIDYFLDFIDSSASISKFNISNIGRRTIVENNEGFNCVFETEVPDFVLIETGQPDTDAKREECIARAQQFIQVDSNVYKGLALGGLFNSCFNEIKMLLYEKTGYNESIQMSCLPLYYLEPNTRIGARDVDADIYGDYMLNSMSIPLRAGATMSINATRVTERL